MRSQVLVRTLLVTLLLGVSLCCQAKSTSLDSIVAVVNEGVITQNQLDAKMAMTQKELASQSSVVPSEAIFARQVLDQLILEEIQLQVAKRTGIEVDDPMLDMIIEDIAKSNKMTVTQLKEALLRDGVTYEAFRERMQRQAILSQLQQRDVTTHITVTKQEVDHFLTVPDGLGGSSTEYNLGHILIELPQVPSTEGVTKAKNRAVEIMAKLQQGQDFNQVLVDSDGFSGGDLGWRTLPEVPTLFVQAVSGMRLNEVQGPIRSPSGFHIITLLGKRLAESQAEAVPETKVRHVLVKTDAMTSDLKATEKLKAFKADIQSGKVTFSEIAKTHSADMASSIKGGELGWVTADKLVPAFQEKMDEMEEKVISEPFQSPFGWHILEVLERRVSTTPEAALRQKAQMLIQKRKFEERLDTWKRQMRDESYVQVLLPELNS